MACCVVAACSRNPQSTAKAFVESGDQYLSKKQYNEAIIEFRNAIEAKPRLAAAHLKLARSYTGKNDFKSAYPEYRRAGELMPDDLDVQAEVGGFLLLGRYFEDAKELARKILLKDSKHLAGLILLGNALAGLRDLESAVAVAERAIDADPLREGGYTNLGVLQLARGSRSDAEEAFKKALAVNPRSVSAHLALANFYRTVGELESAEQSFRRALEVEPTHIRGNRALASFYLETNVASRAEPYLRKVAEVVNDATAWLDLADYLVSQNKHADALAALDRLGTSADNRVIAEIRKASINHSLGRTAEANAILSKLVGANSRNAEAISLQAEFLWSDRRTEDALERANLAVQTDPNASIAHFVLARVQVARQELELARRSFQEVLRLRPNALDAQMELVRLHTRRNEIDTAIQIANGAVRNHPQSLNAHAVLIRSLLVRSEDHPKAAEELRTVTELFPRSPAAVALIGSYEMSTGNAAAARRQFERALQMDPNYLDAMVQLVALDISAGRHNDARRRLRTRLLQQPDNPTLLLLAARVTTAQRQLGEAEQILLHLVRVDPANLEAFQMLGQLYIGQGRHPDAVKAFSAIIERDPKSSAAHTMLGLLYHTQGQVNSAIAHYEKAYEADARSATAANNLAWILAENDRDLDRALTLAQAAQSRLPGHAEILDTLGWVYVKRGVIPVAVTTLEEAVLRDANNPLYAYHLGVAYAKLGDDAKARKSLQRMLKLQPNFARAEDAKKILATLVY